MSTTDEMGDWSDIGVVTPSYEWRLYPSSIIDGKVFRLTYIFDAELVSQKSRFLEMGLARFYYPTNSITVGTSFRIYPGMERKIVYWDTGITLLRDLGVKRVPRKNGVYRYLTPVDWQLKVEYLNNY